MMFFTENQVAEFRDSFYKDGYGFTVSVYENDDQTVTVHSDHLLDDTYANFEFFINDLRIKNPLWFTYYYVRVDKKFKHLVETKLSETVGQVFKWLNTSMMHTQSNWCFEDEGMKNFVQDKIKKELINSLDFTESGGGEMSEEEIELDQMWNGY
jgi:hypothetical protein